MTAFRTPMRMTAASLVLAAVASFSMLAACRPSAVSSPAGSMAGPPATSETSDGRFTLAVRVDSNDPTQITVVVTSTDAAFAEIDAPTADKLIELRAESAVLGSVERVSDHELHFSPAFPLLAGSEVVARFDPTVAPAIDGTPLEHRHRVPSPPAAPAPTVTSVYPTASVLPANHLKFYIVFSEPMQPGEIWTYFQLLDIDNKRPVPRPFRHTELWSRDNKTLTLWFHPGRVKQGVNLNVELGAILVEGRRYRLSISGDWPSARGTPLGNDVTREFTAGTADHGQPDLANWKVLVPAAGSQDPLVCQLGTPHDWALLHSDVAVETASGQPLTGSVSTSNHQATWNFTPRTPWKAGRYRLAVGSVLEDLAGNSIERPFEVDLTNKADVKRAATATAGTVYREFTIVP